MEVMNRNVWVLLIAGSLGLCIAPMMVFVGGIIGAELAPVADLSTFPVACLVIGTACFVIPVSRLMQKHGRKKIFILGAISSSVASLLASVSIAYESFALFSFSAWLLGGALAVIQQYRFAAMESVPLDLAPKAASFILLGGLIAAILGPELADLGKNYLSKLFSGSFVLLAIVTALGACVLVLFQPKADLLQEDLSGGRGIQEIARNTVFWVAVLSATIGYAVMSYIMTATPVSMHIGMSHSLSDTKWVIQSHILAMFLPSLVSGYLIERLGILKLMSFGLLAYAVCLMIALAGQDVMHYWFSLVLLGVGWNFLFVSGTVLLPKSYRAEERFKAQGFNDFFVFAFQSAASILSGVVIHNFGWNYLVVFAVPFLVVQMFMIFLWKFKRESVV